jgi:RND family efflux transporter MFP subunit
LAHDGPRDVVFAVPEDKVDLVKALAAQPGRFKVRLWGGTDAPLPATIREISAAADPMTRTFLVKADIGSTVANNVRLGQTATVLMELPQVAGVTKLPLSALREEQGRSAVWLVDRSSMTVRSQDVKLAGADGNEAVIIAGLAPGQVVVTAGVHVLSPGQKVKFYVDPGMPSASGASAPGATPVGVK